MLLYGVTPTSKVVIVLVILTFAAVASFMFYMDRAPWGALNEKSEFTRQLDEIVAKAPSTPRIALGRRTHEQTHLASSWSGVTDYNATIEGREHEVRITWREIRGVNLITKIELLMLDSPPTVIWHRQDSTLRHTIKEHYCYFCG